MATEDTRQLSALQAIISRRAVRAFLPMPIHRDTINEILQAAGCAPSGTNTQPWRVYVVEGPARDAIAEAVLVASETLHHDPSQQSCYQEDYPYYPPEWFPPYQERRRENGLGLYQTLGIVKGDKHRMHRQHQENYRFFGAPVGLFFTIDKRLAQGSFLDYGMFLQNVMLAARHFGIDTCPQAAWNPFSSIVLPAIGAGDHEHLLCGMSMGHEDKSAAVNRYRATRIRPDEFITWL